MKTQKKSLRKLDCYIRSIKNRMSGFWKYVHFYALNTWLGSFCMNYCINAAWHEDNQSVALLRCNEAQVALIAVFRSSALLGLVSLIFLLIILQRFSMRFGSGEFAGQSSTVTHGHWFWYLWRCGQVPSPAGKWNQHLHKACQQKKALSAIKSPGRRLRWLNFRKHSGPTPADDMAAQIITDCGNFTLDYIRQQPIFWKSYFPCYNTAFFHLRNISKLRNMLSVSDAEKLVHAFMSSRLDYCNALHLQ